MPKISAKISGKKIQSLDPLMPTRPVVQVNDFFKNITNYDFEKNEWLTDDASARASVCSSVIRRIKDAGQDPSSYAKDLYRRGESAHAKLLFRCISREKWSEECTDDEMMAAFSAMGLSNDTDDMNKTVDDIMFGLASSGASMEPSEGGAPHQVGGAPHDLATLLFLKRHLLDKLVEVGPEYAGRLIGWIDGQLATLKGCVQDILGINPATFYNDITEAIVRLYNQGAGLADEAKDRVAEWLSANKATAFGLTAFIVRYQNNIMGAGSAAIGSFLPAIFSAFARAGATVGSVITQFWQSDIGVALVLSLYYYDQNADLINEAAASALQSSKDAADSFMAALKQFEQFSSEKIADYAQVKFNDDLVKMMVKLEQSLSTDDTAHRAELARILAKTALTQARLLETVAQTRQTRSQTARITAAKANLTAVQDQLTAETRSLIAAELAAKGPGKGGKSHSRKLHKKVSASKRPKKSVHSRKAKVAKRSNKKH
jgi:hypothetical protein